MSEKILDAVIVEPQEPARAAVIWLHGLGADGHDFEPVVPQLGIPATMPTQANTWYSRVLGRPMGSVVSVGSNVAVVGVDSVMVAIPSGCRSEPSARDF